MKTSPALTLPMKTADVKEEALSMSTEVYQGPRQRGEGATQPTPGNKVGNEPVAWRTVPRMN